MFVTRGRPMTGSSADATQAAYLRIGPGAALLRTEVVNVDPAGCPIEYGPTWFAGENVTLTVPGTGAEDLSHG